ncbi:hypothetical protein RB979_002655 [Vibrio alginolyticus]|uniref:hypothetical protein n=1 Tax=Vibrio TaxID=662 RepID=UPI000449D3AC|nr:MULTISPECIES: hypothetical protein [Vibrio]EGQ8273113.1 hypothetical protein [Vibrio parahaemolyticus]EJG0872069.1 hypothetical protein [Vibrio parahaemolyticus O3]EJG0900728.1 hypothetical protein [Vibrio parahaemolyticus O3:K56]EJG1075396.1 hypothetical protein [Vibrio parahaemolyticus O1:K56]EGQ8487999.1 hypothetical protein [Vibrio alginolyticus]
MKVEYKATNKTEGVLVNAFQRLLDGKPLHVKATGKLTLNRINNEAQLGNSYVHKFKEFVDYAKPVIEEYNLNRDKAMTTGLDIELDAPLSVLDRLKHDLKKANDLKNKYRVQRNNAIEARKQLEAENARLRFRVFDLQQELLDENSVVTPIK